MRRGLVDLLVAELVRLPSVTVVQRERMDEVVREQALQLSGRVADESAVRVGRLAGATLLVSGSVTQRQGHVRIDAQVVGVEDGAVLGAATAEGAMGDLSAVTTALAKQVVALFPSAHRTPQSGAQPGFVEPAQQFASAAKANDAGERLSREGKLFDALHEFERAMAVDPSHSQASRNYTATVRQLSGSELLRVQHPAERTETAGLIAARLVERFMGTAFALEPAPLRSENTAEGFVTIRLPVKLTLTPAAGELLPDHPATSNETPTSDVGPTASSAGASSLSQEVARETIQRLSAPRRIFLRLLARDGQTLGIYSRLKQWQVASWLAPGDGQRLRIVSGKEVRTEAVFVGLQPAQAAEAAAVQLMVVAVPRERALVNLESGFVEERGASRADPLSAAERRSLTAMIEAAWDPPVTERPWARGYLPTNVRQVVVTMTLTDRGAAAVKDTRLVGTSGDQQFDLAALTAAQEGLRRWSDTQAEGAFPSDAARSVPLGGDPFKVRVQFKLVKDIPPLNLIGPMKSVENIPLPTPSR